MDHSEPLAELELARARAETPYGGTADLPEFKIVPPWHVQHAKALACAAALVVIGAVAGAFYYAKPLRSDPFAEMRLRTPSVSLPANETVPPEPVPARLASPPPPQPVARTEPSEPARAAAPRMALPARSTPVPETSTGATAATSTVPAVTHTRRSEAAPAAPANQSPAPRRAGCTEAAEVLGLCENK